METVPKNGLLSGMIITAFTAVTVIPLGMLHEPFLARFSAPLTPELRNWLFASICLMALHKLESYWFAEYDRCPAYWTLGQASWAANPRKAVFMGFVPTFIGMLFFTYFAFLGPPWHLLILTVWIAQGLHELHHSAKSLARRYVYPGLLSSLLFVGCMSFAVFPAWHDLLFAERGAFFHGYYLLLPVVFTAFLFEDRVWISRTPEFAWNGPRK